MRFLSLLILFSLLSISSRNPIIHDKYSPPGLEEKVKGITLVAPPRKFTSDPIQPIKLVNANWIALVPYGFSRLGQPEVYYSGNKQWWGETPEGIIESIKVAKSQGVRIMLKPQVFIGRSWVGDVDFTDEKQWKIWEDSYRKYIITFARIAAEYKVEMFCIGTEYKIAAQKRERFWRELIREVRQIFSGPITYSSNWDGYKKVPFWDALDYIGLSAYFPLTDMKTPTIPMLKKEWKPILNKLKRFSAKNNRQILFTEYGYLSVDYCANKNWLLEKKISTLEINEEAQSNAIEALLATFGEQNFWLGGFLWKWFPQMRGHEGYPEKDYTPQGKLAELTLREWYGKI